MRSSWKKPPQVVTTSGSWLSAGMRRGSRLSELNELRPPRRGRGKKGPDLGVDDVALPSGLVARPRTNPVPVSE